MTRNPITIFAIVGLALFMSAIDYTIVAVALPSMIDQFQTSLAWVGLTVTAYQLMNTIVAPIAGKLSDDWGRKRLFLGAVALFTASSVACGLAPNIYLLVVFRVLQALGGGAFYPSATGIVSDSFGAQRMRAIGLFSSIFPLGGILGPNIGGLIVEHVSWRWIFMINGPIGLVLLLLGLRLLPAMAPPAERRRLDVVGTLLFAGAMTAILYGITTWADDPRGEAHPITWVLLMSGAVLLAGFLWQESRAETPVIELTLLRSRAFAASNLYNFFYGAAALGFTAFIPYYASVAYGLSAEQSGLILTPRSVAQILFSTLTSLYVIRLGYRGPMMVGGLLIATTMFLLSQGYHDVPVLGLVLPNMLLLAAETGINGVGTGVLAPASNNAVVDLLPERVSAVTGLRSMFLNTGSVISTSVAILVLSRFSDKAQGLQTVFFAWGVLAVLITPLVFLIPDMARARRQQKRQSENEPLVEPASSGP